MPPSGLSQESYPLARLVDVEPDHVPAELARVMPVVRELIRPMLDAGIVAAAIIRPAACHYVVRATIGPPSRRGRGMWRVSHRVVWK